MIYYCIAVTGGSISTLAIGDMNTTWLNCFVLLFTFFGFYQNLRWSFAFECHRNRVNSLIRTIEGMYPSSDKKIVLPTVEIEPMELWIFGALLRTRYMFSLFYFMILILFLVVFQGEIRFLASFILVIASLLILGSILSFDKLDGTVNPHVKRMRDLDEEIAEFLKK